MLGPSRRDYENLYAALQESIDGLKSSYPLDYQKIDIKSSLLVDQLPYFTGSKLADVGSNFGMYSILSSRFALQVFAIERSRQSHEVARAAVAFFKENHYSLTNLSLKNLAVSALDAVDYDALLLSLVLYHLSNDEVDGLVEDARKKCERMIIQCRPGRAIKYETGALTDHVSRNTRFDGCYDIAGCVKFMREVGMSEIEIKVDSRLYGGEVFPVLLGKR